MIKHAPRLLIAGTGSGCGKTTAVCAILQALKNRGHEVASFKCGPDYIDPMFHSEIIGAQSTNIDLFFSDESKAIGLCRLRRRSNASVARTYGSGSISRVSSVA